MLIGTIFVNSLNVNYATFSINPNNPATSKIFIKFKNGNQIYTEDNSNDWNMKLLTTLSETVLHLQRYGGTQ